MFVCLFIFSKIKRAGLDTLTDRFWPAGRMFDTPALKWIQLAQVSFLQRVHFHHRRSHQQLPDCQMHEWYRNTDMKTMLDNHEQVGLISTNQPRLMTTARDGAIHEVEMNEFEPLRPQLFQVSIERNPQIALWISLVPECISKSWDGEKSEAVNSHHCLLESWVRCQGRTVRQTRKNQTCS